MQGLKKPENVKGVVVANLELGQQIRFYYEAANGIKKMEVGQIMAKSDNHQQVVLFCKETNKLYSCWFILTDRLNHIKYHEPYPSSVSVNGMSIDKIQQKADNLLFKPIKVNSQNTTLDEPIIKPSYPSVSNDIDVSMAIKKFQSRFPNRVTVNK